uniref:Protein PQN-24 n=1 Tax=Haemonchus contortus TaxID=6289 RepID=W6NRL5_HAECO
MLLLILLAVFPSISSLTCYNGLKLLRMQSVGQSTEECPASAYCYNMTASAALVVDVVKAGCSTWRCMLARDKCISTTFQFVPVSLCCCSYDRCNVGENPAYDESSSRRDSGSSFAEPRRGSLPTSPPSSGRWSPKQIEDKFKDYDVDHRDDNNNGGEEEFRRVDWRETPPPATRGGRRESVGREIELRV